MDIQTGVETIFGSDGFYSSLRLLDKMYFDTLLNVSKRDREITVFPESRIVVVY